MKSVDIENMIITDIVSSLDILWKKDDSNKVINRLREHNLSGRNFT